MTQQLTADEALRPRLPRLPWIFDLLLLLVAFLSSLPRDIKLVACICFASAACFLRCSSEARAKDTYKVNEGLKESRTSRTCSLNV